MPERKPMTDAERWDERIPMLSINPDAADRDDVARLVADLMHMREWLAETQKALDEAKHLAYIEGATAQTSDDADDRDEALLRGVKRGIEAAAVLIRRQETSEEGYLCRARADLLDDLYELSAKQIAAEASNP